jgi:hypothetical protein
MIQLIDRTPAERATGDGDSPTNTCPRLSIVVPLFNDRGCAVASVESWVHQSAPAEQYQIVVIGDGRRRLEDRVRRLLRPGDRFVPCDTTNEAVIYNVGAEVSTAPLLVLTESHAIPERDVAESVLRYFREHDVESATLASFHGAPNRVAAVDGSVQKYESPSMTSLGRWRTVSLRGFAIRREAFFRFGKFDVDCLRFAETTLAVRLQRAGCEIGHVGDAAIQHVDVSNLRQMARDLRSGTYGECAFRDREGATADAMMGPMPQWSERGAFSRPLARQLVRNMIESTWRDFGRKGWLRKVRASSRLVAEYAAVATLGHWGAAAMTKLEAHLRGLSFYVRLALRPGRSERRIRRMNKYFHAVRVAWVRVGVVDYLRGRRFPAAPYLDPKRETPLAAINDDFLAGFYASETWRGELCRWTEPAAAMRFSMSPGSGRFLLRLRTYGSLADRCLRVLFNRYVVPLRAMRLEGDRLEFDVPADAFRSGEQILSWTCAPCDPGAFGVTDYRTLGVAISSIRFERHASAQ